MCNLNNNDTNRHNHYFLASGNVFDGQFESEYLRKFDFYYFERNIFNIFIFFYVASGWFLVIRE